MVPYLDQFQSVVRLSGIDIHAFLCVYCKVNESENVAPYLTLVLKVTYNNNNNNKALLPYSTCKNYMINWNVVWR